jgi:hypothetical protein
MSAAEDRSYEPRQERPISGLFADLARETTNLARTEIELAKAELTEKAGQAAGGVVFLAVGGFIAYAGLLVLLAAAVLGLALVVEPWLAALIVGLVVVAIGAVVLMMGKKRLSANNLQPKRTMETLRDDKRWARSQLAR